MVKVKIHLNGWCIGQLPNNLIDGTISDILASLVSKYRIFANVYTYNAGAHKAIKGHHTFFLNDPEHVGSSFQYLMKSGVQPDVYVMICGRVTPTQRKIIKQRCTINTQDYMIIMNWLIDNHPSYIDLIKPESCPQPIVIGGFEETTNNTDEPGENMIDTETTIDGEETTYSSRNEPSESTGPFKSEKDFIFSHIQGQKPTLLFRRGDIVGSHTIDLVDMFPLIFPFGRGGLNERRATNYQRVLY